MDLIMLLTTIAAAAALWFRWSSDRAAKRALALILRDAPQREPGLTLEIIRAQQGEIELQVINPANSWNLVTKLGVEGGPSHPTVPFVVPAQQRIDVRLRVDHPAATIVLIDIDGRRTSVSAMTGRSE
jgi:hypothetical protein